MARSHCPKTQDPVQVYPKHACEYMLDWAQTKSTALPQRVTAMVLSNAQGKVPIKHVPCYIVVSVGRKKCNVYKMMSDLCMHVSSELLKAYVQ